MSLGSFLYNFLPNISLCMNKHNDLQEKDGILTTHYENLNFQAFIKEILYRIGMRK